MTEFPEQRRLVISLVFGFAAAGAVWWHVHSLEKETADRRSLVPVLVASEYVPQGTRLNAALFQVRHIPRMYVQPSCIAASELLDERGGELYESLLPLSAGEQLTASRLCRIGLSGGFSWLIPEGRVALSLELSPERGVAGLVEPGDSVDVLAVFETNEGLTSHHVTSLLFQNVRVLGVGDRLIGGRTKKTGPEGDKEKGFLPNSENSSLLITLAVRPYESLVITHAREAGTLRLTLRPLGDSTVFDIPPVDSAVIVGEKGRTAAPSPGPQGDQRRENLKALWKDLETSFPVGKR